MGPKILTVDDSKTIRMLVARAFRPFACEVLEAADGVEGLTVAQRERPDIILLDLTMPIMDGVEMLTRLKADPDLRPIPVVMLTAESGRDTVLRIAKFGVRDYLVKPFKVELMVERVSRIIELKARNEVHPRVRRFGDALQILVVDDHPAIVEQIQASLAGTPWKVSGVSQTGQAVDSCGPTLPDIILISLSLPEGSGFALFQMFQSSVRTKAVPILALSVKTATEEQTRAQQLGFTGLVTKPIDSADLQLKITRALSLDTSHNYFQRRDHLLVLTLPANFNQLVANDICLHLRPKVCEAVDAGLSRLVLDLSQLKAADATLIKLGLQVIQLCAGLGIRYGLVGSAALGQECKNHEETRDWQFSSSFEEALAVLNGKTLTMA
ncbi:MAG: response regulator [Verrucomicrobiota bacterium]|jgi:two-component system cell cycle response regulator